MSNADVFETYFRMADTDQDGRISGKEGVTFFQSTSLPQKTLAKIWQFADQGQTGYLSRPEFFAALRLVTVAQSGREITPELARAAISGPAAASIPPPRIVQQGMPPQGQFAPSQEQQQKPGGYGQPPRSFSQQPAPQGQGFGQPPAPQGQGFGQPPAPQGQGFGQPPAPQGQGFGGGSFQAQRPPGGGLQPSMGGSGNFGGGGPSWSAQPAPGAPPQGPQSFGDGGMGFKAQPTQPTTTPKAAPAADAFDAFGGDAFGGGAFQAKPSGGATKSGGPSPPSGVVGGGGSGMQPADAFGGDMFSSSGGMAPKQNAVGPQSGAGGGGFGDQGFRATTAPVSVNQGVPGQQLVTASAAQADLAQGGFGGPGMGASTVGSGAPWPRMTQMDVQRYTKVFAEVDLDRDGKITGEQARDLFLSWRLPREVLKQVWELSDQDCDSMLSGREFCTALYLMERFREGRPLPPVLPTGIHLDEPAGQARGGPPPSTGYVASWSQPQAPTPAPAPAPSSMQMPQLAELAPAVLGQYKSKVPVLDQSKVNQLARDEQEALRNKHKDTEDVDKKVWQTEQDMMDSKQKIEFYRTKMQEIILYKTRCDNRLAEITERAASEKREVDSLAKKYDERYKATGEVSSRLQAEDLAFRDLQEKKMELYTAVSRLEAGGDPNALIQERADRLINDLDELRKAATERAKTLGLVVRAPLVSEMPFGWQPGMQEGAVEWDEDWDKFADEGFTPVDNLMDAADMDFGGGGDAPPSTGLELTFTGSGNTPVAPASWTGGSGGDDAFEFASSEAGGQSKVEDTFAPMSGSDSPAMEPISSQSPVPVAKSTLGKSSAGANSRYSEVSESQDFGAAFNGPPSINSSTSFDAGPASFNSTAGDPFGETGGGMWASSFQAANDEEADSGMRASWGLQSNPPSTHVSYDAGGGRSTPGQGFGGFGDSTSFQSSPLSRSTTPAASAAKMEEDPFASLGPIKRESAKSGLGNFASPRASLGAVAIPGKERGPFDEPDPFSPARMSEAAAAASAKPSSGGDWNAF